MVRTVWSALRRVSFDLVVFFVLLYMLSSGVVESLKPPLQLLSFKAILVSAGFLHAHILRKIAFPRVEWNNLRDDAFKKLLVIFIYVVVIYVYGRGG